jgi:hypothetical protein
MQNRRVCSCHSLSIFVNESGVFLGVKFAFSATSAAVLTAPNRPSEDTFSRPRRYSVFKKLPGPAPHRAGTGAAAPYSAHLWLRTMGTGAPEYQRTCGTRNSNTLHIPCRRREEKQGKKHRLTYLPARPELMAEKSFSRTSRAPRAPRDPRAALRPTAISCMHRTLR